MGDVFKYGKNITQERALKLYIDYPKPRVAQFRPGQILNGLHSLVKPLNLEFKDGGVGFAFRNKVGAAAVGAFGRALEELAGTSFFNTTKSEIFRGALDSITDDSALVGVASVWGNYPF